MNFPSFSMLNLASRGLKPPKISTQRLVKCYNDTLDESKMYEPGVDKYTSVKCLFVEQSDGA